MAGCSEIPDPTTMSASTSLESEDGRERRNSLGLSLGPSTPPLFTPHPRRSSPVPRSMSRGSRPSSPARGRSRSPITTPLGHSPPASPRHLPSYAHSALDRAPSPSPELMIPRPKVPPSNLPPVLFSPRVQARPANSRSIYLRGVWCLSNLLKSLTCIRSKMGLRLENPLRRIRSSVGAWR